MICITSRNAAVVRASTVKKRTPGKCVLQHRQSSRTEVPLRHCVPPILQEN
ncbi:Hypothetical protein AA314_09922 [Archangium gephyra]|uniref:Uncharacterized protein n=1 Tax=Archangium gephyra TaxID=48 RepID=A0AAC8TKJ9_9BACT|nr:Hypothetical protein AA314_09922 [Archangium gephyra]